MPAHIAFRLGSLQGERHAYFFPYTLIGAIVMDVPDAVNLSTQCHTGVVSRH